MTISSYLCGAWSLVLGITAAGWAYAAPNNPQEDHPDNPFAAFVQPKGDAPRAIGDYSNGCLQGAARLPLDGRGYQVMHPSRRRTYGHPHLVQFIQTLAQRYSKATEHVLLVGDLSQPRGGKAPGGHASHQIGLDVDIWYWHPKRAIKRPLSMPDRERLRARSILDGTSGKIRKSWKRPVLEALRITASQPRVERVFVNPAIKRELCTTTDGDRTWLAKVRPWYGHDDHFHVRLACPQDSPLCEAQNPTPAGDGCAALAWWFDEKAQAERRKAQARYRHKVVARPKWPKACNALLD